MQLKEMDGNLNFQNYMRYLWENNRKTTRSLSGKEVKRKYEQSVLQGLCLLIIPRANGSSKQNQKIC
jgi:hypothetical protein